MTAFSTLSYKAVGGVKTKIYPPHFSLIFFIRNLSATCWKALTCCPVIQANHAAKWEIN